MPDMTVKDLIERLQSLPPEFKVIMAKNADGGGFSPLCNVELQQYVPPKDGKSRSYGNIEYGLPNAVTLWPVV